ncbi:MAG: hypothetical protein A4E62_02238 [Syntrophorhabdus sp. PtaU1.Bin002]|nr:MAG: hypothetical protein A4E62_02238 [Syntrophorhabdus sp. PtaU1.Bin002]
MKSFRISIDDTIPFTTPLWIASGVSDCGMATGMAPRRFTTSAPVPDTLSSIPFKSLSDFTGLLVIKSAGGQVNRVKSFTFSNSFALYFSMRS